MKKLMIVIMGLLYAATVYAAPGTNKAAHFVWNAPATDQSGNAITPDQISGYYLYWHDEAGKFPEPGDQSAAANANRINITPGTTVEAVTDNFNNQNPADGIYTFAITAYNENGESGYSASITASVVGGVLQVSSLKKFLSPPTNLIIE